MKINLNKYKIEKIEADQEKGTIEFIAEEIECKLVLNQETFQALIEICADLLKEKE